jgi:epoxide hydrolase-like protein
MTEIDGLDIHFLHVRSEHENALPLIVTHGWPGSIIEQLKIIEPLTNPTTHGAADAFHLVMMIEPGEAWCPSESSAGSHLLIANGGRESCAASRFKESPAL